MGRLQYWHPVLGSRDLRAATVRSIKIAGQSIAVFRSEDGHLGAVDDQCAHRRMKLSLGHVLQDKLICPYHGWSFTREGAGESPSAPKMHACQPSYDCAEAFSVIWLKARGTTHELPRLQTDNGDFFGPVFNKVHAPLQLVIDNFSEVEHTVVMHGQFGLDPARASEATVELEPAGDSITMHNRGPAKMPSPALQIIGGIRRGDHFHCDYTFRFDPPRTSVKHRWTEPKSGRERAIKYHVFHYLVPEDEETTNVVSFGFLMIRSQLVKYFLRPTGWIFRAGIRRIVDEDGFLLGNLADKSCDLEGMKLSRFDSILGLTRERLRRIYDAN